MGQDDGGICGARGWEICGVRGQRDMWDSLARG